ncbi:MAG TPA: SUMF1/EgtB/PvdO family nonheme iron enzyme [Terriglobales bacterium]|jgi:ergothioneine biosynthesis protein EgtB|nr:SUMF1/EgtB/PvdO family nonheme iron enzyme [Terriglobales bacterium]
MALLSPKSLPDKADLLRERYLAAWSRTDQIFAMVPSSAMLAQPIVWRHPLIFYVGHLPAFSWNQICGGILSWQSFNPYFDDLFCRGIDPDVDTGECHWHPEVPEEWPTLQQTTAYRDAVRDAILRAIESMPERASNDVLGHGGRVFDMVLEHEYMHQETLLYMLQQLPFSSKRRPSMPLAYSFRKVASCQPVRIPQGRARLGARFEDIAFGWDNEFTETVVEVPAFTIDSLPVTNAEYLEFIESGAHDDERYWRSQDWRWKNLENKRHPATWYRQDKRWFYRSMFDVFPLEQVAHWPVYVSLAEARAYARWRGKRLPTEAEFHRAAYYGPNERETQHPWGNGEPRRDHGNFAFVAWSPMPVGFHPSGTSRWGVAELVGNGWELTDTPFAPLPEFTPYMRTYPDYSQDFFDGKHFVLKGASWATAAEMLRPSFRNWYQAHYPYVFAKFRCVAD